MYKIGASIIHILVFWVIHLFIFCSTVPVFGQTVHWAKALGEPGGAAGLDICNDALSNAYVTGTFFGPAAFGAYTLTSNLQWGDIYVAKSDSAGTILWAKQFGGSDADQGNGIVADGFGSIYVTGSFSGTAVFDSYSLTSSGGGYNGFLARLDATTGNVIWVQKYGGGGSDAGLSLACDSAGNIYTAGEYTGTGIFGTYTITALGLNDAFLAKADATTGNVIWVKRMGGTGADAGQAVSYFAGQLYFTGGFQYTANYNNAVNLSSGGSLDCFIICANANSGNFIWAKSIGSSGFDEGLSVSHDPSGNVLLSGVFSANTSFGTSVFSSVGGMDGFLAKLNVLNGNVLWAQQTGGPSNDGVQSVASDGLGNAYITASFSGAGSTGTQSISAWGGGDLFISKTNGLNGNVEWVKQMGGTGFETGYSLSMDPQGHLYAAGLYTGLAAFGTHTLTVSGGGDAFILKMDTVFSTPTATSVITALAEQSRGSFLSVFPNPFTGKLSLVLEGNIQEPCTLQITDVLGKTVWQGICSGSSVELDLSGLTEGVYYLLVTVNNRERKAMKLVKAAR